MSKEPIELNKPYVISNEHTHLTTVQISPGIFHMVYRLPGEGDIVLEMVADANKEQNEIKFLDKVYWNVLIKGRPATEKDFPLSGNHDLHIEPSTRTIRVDTPQ